MEDSILIFMKRILLIIIPIILILGTLAGFFLFLYTKSGEETPSPDVLFPVGDSIPEVEKGSTKPKTMTLSLQTGSSVTSNNFIDNGVTIADEQNSSTYYLAGSLDYCTPSGTCLEGFPSEEFKVIYFSESQTFIVSLITEPLGQSRNKAEQFILRTLGVSQEEMCLLSYEVLVPSGINETYSGKNLGFSFCPGAIVLP